MLKGANATDPSINQSWQLDNQAWSDLYVTLYDNADQQNDGSLEDLPPIPNFDAGLDNEIEDELSRPYTLERSHCLEFRENGFISYPMFFLRGQWRACERNSSNFFANPLIQKPVPPMIIVS